MSKVSSQPRFRLSKYAKRLPLPDGRLVVAHPFYAERTILEAELAAVLELFAEHPLSLDDLLEHVEAEEDSLREVVSYLCERHYLTEVDEDEDASLFATLRLELGGTTVSRAAQDTDKRRRYRAAQAMSMTDVVRPRALRKEARRIRVLVIGSCFADYTADALEAQARPLGLDVEVATAWSDDQDAITRFDPDLVVIQPASTWLIAPLWDEAPFLEDGEREARLEVLKRALDPLLRLTRGPRRLWLFQGFSTPQHSPLGLAEFRQLTNFQRIVYELNQHIIDFVRENPDALFIDAERIFGNVGKSRLLDDAIAPFSHQSAIDGQTGDVALVPGPSREETYDVKTRLHAAQLLAQAYLDAYRLWSGHGRIKCIIVDLDRTLWPAILGESSLVSPQVTNSLRFGVYGGIHQALLMAKARGVLLAVASMNNESEALERWTELTCHASAQGLRHVLAPSDFVSLRINWRRKSENVADILNELGLGPDNVLFIDDEAIHRADVSESFPDIRTHGQNMHALRGFLLSEPGLQVNMQTRESQRRTTLVREQLARDLSRSQIQDEREFLGGLRIRLSIRRAQHERDLTRVCELLQRTNQFNTSLVRYSQSELATLLCEADHAVYCLEVEDRFGHYGLVGVCVLRGPVVDTLAISCRVIGLKLAIPFLTTVLREHQHTPVRAFLRAGPRNHPCRDVFEKAGFVAEKEGWFSLADLRDLSLADEAIYQIKVTNMGETMLDGASS